MAEDDNWWTDAPFATAASAKASAMQTGSAGKAKTTPQDMMILRDSSAKAQVERDAQRAYADTRRAVQTMGTGPYKAAWLDAITPEPDGGIFDKIGGFLGLLPRQFISDETMQARDQMNTVSAQTALTGSQMMKGSSSDRDTALMRMAGVGPAKSVGENLRLLDKAERDSHIEQVRADLKSGWISRFGSISARSPNGATFEHALADAENRVLHPESFQKPTLRSAPPSTRKAPSASRRVVYDINGNPI